MDELNLTDQQISNIVNKLYIKILQDDSLKVFFDDIFKSPMGIMNQEKKQRKFIKSIVDKTSYSDEKLLAAHRRSVSEGLNECHFAQFIAIFKKAMSEAEIPPDQQKLLVQEVVARKGPVLGKLSSELKKSS